MAERSHRRRPPKKPARARKHPNTQPVIKYVSIAPRDLHPSGKIDWALIAIASEMESNEGIYPHTRRLPNIQEVLRRAGLGSKYLERKRDTAQADYRREMLKNEIKMRLSEINGTRPLPIASKAPGSSDAYVESKELRRIRQLWCERELEFIEIENCLAQAKAEIARLHDENLKLQAQRDTANLHVLSRR